MRPLNERRSDHIGARKWGCSDFSTRARDEGTCEPYVGFAWVRIGASFSASSLVLLSEVDLARLSDHRINSSVYCRIHAICPYKSTSSQAPLILGLRICPSRRKPFFRRVRTYQMQHPTLGQHQPLPVLCLLGSGR